ncbi:F-box only protein 4 isoform X2 [Phyllopteryx taeniolatus]|uniref:F-box only protein 4 isoform X2 n=1 Tax=Phyllopteryx taeniolatus TaxID=161469 RepID=UPI002AD2E2D3|nr:F-box only protein 4 isoform X2 [Phyllopteryx taeniolatus]
MAGNTKRRSESVVIRSLRRLKESYWPSGVRDVVVDHGEQEPGFLDCLPVDVQFRIMTLLSSVDICRLGATSRYWRALVRDPLLWRFFLLRDTPHWSSIDHLSMPQLEAPEALVMGDDAEEGDYERTESKVDYMAEYLKGCPSCRKRWLPSWPPYRVLTAFLQSLVASAEPRYAMFGPGMEQLDVSIVTRLMHASDVLPVSVIPNSQVNGPSVIGSGISYMFNNQHKFNIFTLYSTNKAERDRAKEKNQYMSDKLFSLVGSDDSGHPVYRPAPQVQQVCQVVEGVIYVANAEPGRGEGETEGSQIRAVLSSKSRPLLVLSCVSREESKAVRTTSMGTRHRTPCVEMAKRLSLPQLPNPWMVQDTVAESLSGLLDGISWLLRSSGVKVYGS